MDRRLRAADLAPGDAGITSGNWSGLSVRGVQGREDPDFADAFARLWTEFGVRGEMEHPDVIAGRLAWDPAHPVGNTALLYELLVLRQAGEIVAVRDHAAVVRLDERGHPRAEPTVVHLSHALIEPAHRGTGLAGWLRTLPLDAARRCAHAAGRADAPIILVAEMEHPDRSDTAGMTRLRSYERAGFRKIDPAAAPYNQPDFRPPALLEGKTPVSLPLALIVRRVGAEGEDAMPAEEVTAVVQSIYAVYAVHLAREAVEPVRAAAASWTARDEPFRLVAPTA